MALSAAQALPLIARYESGGRNIPNQMGPGGTPLSTASGYYQITDATWRQYASGAGIDPAVFPTAISDPSAADQAKVATALYNAKGWQPWSSNAALMAAVASGVMIDPLTGEQVDPTTGQPIGVNPTPGSAPVEPVNPTVTQGTTLGPAAGILTPMWELISRGLLIALGGALILVAVVALLWQSKTVQTSVGTLSRA